VQVGPAQHLAALRINDLALLVDDVVIFQDVLADVEVVALDPLLDRLDHASQHPRLECLVLEASTVHPRLEPLAAKAAHQLILERDVETAGARVTLASGAPAQLVVDAPRLVPLGPDDVEPALLPDPVAVLAALDDHLLQDLGPALGVDSGRILAGARQLQRVFPVVRPDHREVDALPAQLVAGHTLGVSPQQDVDTAPGHIRRNRHRARLTRLGDDQGLALVVLGVEHAVWHLAARQLLRQPLGGLDRRGTHEYRPPRLIGLLDLVDHSRELGLLRLVDQVRHVQPAVEAATIGGLRLLGRFIYGHLVVVTFPKDATKGHARLPGLDLALLEVAKARLVLDVGRQHDDVEVVDLAQLLLFGRRRTGHSRQLPIHTEEVLEGDRSIGQ